MQFVAQSKSEKKPHFAENIQRPHVSRAKCCKNGLELSHSALLELDNTFNCFNFAFSISTIITHFFDLGTFLKSTQIEGRAGSTLLWGM